MTNVLGTVGVPLAVYHTLRTESWRLKDFGAMYLSIGCGHMTCTSLSRSVTSVMVCESLIVDRCSWRREENGQSGDSLAWVYWSYSYQWAPVRQNLKMQFWINDWDMSVMSVTGVYLPCLDQVWITTLNIWWHLSLVTVLGFNANIRKLSLYLFLSRLML